MEKLVGMSTLPYSCPPENLCTKNEILCIYYFAHDCMINRCSHLFQVGEVVTTIPTIGFNVEQVTYKNLNCNKI